MKKLSILILLLVVGCIADPIGEDFTYKIETPESLMIEDFKGIKLESYIVTEEVRINAKLPSAGKYRIKIRNFTNTVVSQEIINGDLGDNILNVYVRTLEPSSYTIELLTEDNLLVGRSAFAIN